MKKLIFVLVLSLAAISVAQAADRSPQFWKNWKFKTVNGNGITATRAIDARPFEVLNTSRSVKVTLVAEGGNIRIEGDQNLLEYIVVEYDGPTLNITTKATIRLAGAIRVVVPTHGRIRSINATSSSKVVCETPLIAPDVRLMASSSGEIVAAVNSTTCNLEASSSANIYVGIHARDCNISASSSADIIAALVAQSCSVRASSSADVQITGEAERCAADLSSSADLKAEKFMVKELRVGVSSSADAVVCCTQKLTASAKSSGSVRYRGDCVAVTSVSSGGRIEKED